jgi:hypothetical protein
MPLLSPDQRLLANLRRLKSGFEQQVITNREFIDSFFYEFAQADRVYGEIIPDLWDMIPASLQAEFASRIRDAVRPDFQWRPFYINGSQGTDDGDRRKCDQVGTARIRAWAIEFIRYLDSLDAVDAEAMAAIEEGLNDIKHQRTRPFREVLDEIRRSGQGD